MKEEDILDEVMDSCVSVRQKEVWKDYIERIMNEENDCDHNVEGDAVDCVSGEEVMQALDEMRIGITCGPSHVSEELLAGK